MGQSKVPEISIDDALALYLSVAFPQGLPPGEEGEQVLQMLKAKIASERPEWAKASGWEQEEDSASISYSAIKQQSVEEANREEVPEDAFEERRMEAAENRERKKAEQKEVEQEDFLRRAVVRRKQEEDEALHQRAALIKKVLLKARDKAKLQLSSDEPDQPSKDKVSFSETHDTVKNPSIQNQPLGFSERTDTTTSGELGIQLDSEVADDKPKGQPDAREWFKDFKSLSLEGRAESIRSYNMRKREMLDTKEDLLWDRRKPRKLDLGFDLELDSKKNESLSFGDANDSFGLSLE